MYIAKNEAKEIQFCIFSFAITLQRKHKKGHPNCGHPTMLASNHRQISNVSRTKSPNLNASRVVFHLSLQNLLMPGVK